MSGREGNLETRTLLDEFRNFDKGGLFDLGHPLLNRIAESFVKSAGVLHVFFFFVVGIFSDLVYMFSAYPFVDLAYGFVFFQIGAVQAVSREAYFTVAEGVQL